MRPNRRATLVISCHADTGFRRHWLRRENGRYFGLLDNFAGVYAVMTAYFSGRLTQQCVRIELTCGEERGMDGAYEVARTVSPNDAVVVVDVTGVETGADITIEKCKAPQMQRFVREALNGLRYVLFEDCPDPVANLDESDVYRKVTDNVVFLGIPCRGGDYNEGPVECSRSSIDTAAEALIRFASRWERASANPD
ncbi:MAG: M28 family peptidase [Kiritimatiellae bacterium]|nr:M28 family peptidase [Kiritimatiellia bacterium]